MAIEDEYPSGMDIEREKEYQRHRSELKKAEAQKCDETADAVLFSNGEDDELERYSLTDEEMREFEEEQKAREKEDRQIFMSKDEELKFPERFVQSCKRAQRVKDYKWSEAILDFLSEHPCWEERIQMFENDNDDVVLQWFPFSYPEDFINKEHLCSVSTTSNVWSNDCSPIFYNPLSIYDSNNTELTEEDTIEDSIDFRFCDPEQVVGDSIQQALREMAWECTDRVKCIDIIAAIPNHLHHCVLSYIIDILLFFQNLNPDIKVRVSVNEFLPASVSHSFELGWKYLLYGKPI